jgi:hypothetical protein
MSSTTPSRILLIYFVTRESSSQDPTNDRRHPPGRGWWCPLCCAISCLVIHITSAQGFFNLLVYVRPSFNSWREAHPHESISWVIMRIMYLEEVLPKPKSATITTISSPNGLSRSKMCCRGRTPQLVILK